MKRRVLFKCLVTAEMDMGNFSKEYVIYDPNDWEYVSDEIDELILGQYININVKILNNSTEFDD